MSDKSRAQLASAALCSIALLFGADLASAAGGASIAAAPQVPYGQQQVGNTATDTNMATCSGQKRSSWWQLPVTTGDQITIDYEGPGVNYAYAYPLGTTDFNLGKTNSLADSRLDDNGRQQMKFSVPGSGIIPLEFSTYNRCNFGQEVEPGPYAFTAYVKHAMLVSVPRRASLPRSGSLAVSVRNPDGAPIAGGPGVTLKLRAGSVTRAFKAPVTNGKATVRYQLPKSFRGKRVTINAQAAGSEYLTKFSASQTSRIR